MASQELSFQAEDLLLRQALIQLARVSRKEWGEVIKSNSRLIAVNLAFQTQPKGDGADAKLMGEKAVSRDLAALYASAPDAFAQIRYKDEAAAKGFYKAMLQGDLREARRILQSSGSRWRNIEIGPFDSSLHRKNRDRRGRVNRRVPALIVSGGISKEAAYRKRKIRMVGFAKAGWAAAAASLTGNTRGIPQFVTRHKSRAPGHAVDHTALANNPHVVLHNDVRYIQTACPPSQRARALQYQREKMIAHVRKVTTASARRTFGAIAIVT